MKILQRIGLFLLFLACGLLVFSSSVITFPSSNDQQTSLGGSSQQSYFSLLRLFARRSERFNKYWLILFAFFTALTAISIDYYFGLSKLIYPCIGIM